MVRAVALGVFKCMDILGQKNFPKLVCIELNLNERLMKKIERFHFLPTIQSLDWNLVTLKP